MRQARAAVLAFVVLLVGPAGALAEIDPTSKVVCGLQVDSDHRLSWQSFEQQNRERLERDQYALLEAVVLESFEGEGYRTESASRFREMLGRLYEKQEITAKAFGIVKTGGLPPRQLLFMGEPQQIELPPRDCAEDEADVLNELRYYADLVRNLADRRLVAIRTLASIRIKELEQQYDAYLFEGFPMFPWEAAVNSWFLADRHLSNGPPRNQIVLAHPSVGLIAGTETFSDSEIDPVLAVEPIGWIRYDKDYTKWRGIAALVALPEGRGGGAGVSFHYNNFRLGVTWHDEDADNTIFDDEPSVFLGLDLYQFVGERYRSYRQYKARLEQRIEERKEALRNRFGNTGDGE